MAPDEIRYKNHKDDYVYDAKCRWYIDYKNGFIYVPNPKVKFDWPGQKQSKWEYYFGTFSLYRKDQ